MQEVLAGKGRTLAWNSEFIPAACHTSSWLVTIVTQLSEWSCGEDLGPACGDNSENVLGTCSSSEVRDHALGRDSPIPTSTVPLPPRSRQ